jgi:uncharacterized protein YqjF (DUF2071 family)
MTTSLAGLISAQWRDLVMLSYEVDPRLLLPYVPAGTSLDFHNGRALVTVVGFRVLATRVAGLPLPLHQDFEQVNFRFYVWRKVGAEIRHGAVFLKEIVPSLSMTLGARLFFGENYVAAPMRHEVTHGEHGWASYEWQASNRWNRVAATRNGVPAPAAANSIEAFVQERRWGYARQTGGATLEYHVEHPSWAVSPVSDPTLDCDVAGVYGTQFVTTLSRSPISAFIAEGSEAVLQPGTMLE